ncbi:MAG: reductive dehalogenase domain-containing protein, partial [Alphaproteobacteria bacterium]|nr:reductive dehalogenase domain-containing protein [Alphaproteobacteria bacterium]
RPYHLGPYPLETQPRDDGIAAAEAVRPRLGPMPDAAPAKGPLGAVARDHLRLFAEVDVEAAPGRAPVPDDLERRAADLKGFAYFMDASQVGACKVPDSAWREGTDPPGHGHAIVVLVAYGRVPETDNPARAWIAPAVAAVSEMRAAEIAVCLTGHVRRMGFAATAHVAGCSGVDEERLAVLAGLAVRATDGLRNPYVDRGFALTVVTLAYPIATDRPLAATAPNAKGLRYWLGFTGAMSGRERNRRAGRATHMSRYPMEQVRRVARPTTLIFDDEVPRVAKRASFFDRALRGDLGEKARKERNRFAFKQPHTSGMMAPMRAMVPRQGGVPANADTARYRDPAANARALLSLSYHLGADLTGICEIPDYAWYSHDGDGKEITPSHRYAVVMLIDQEYDTMEGASGDDWISGAQSMRAYLRGAEIAGVMAETVRRLGFGARSQTNVDSEVLHIPLVLWAGLGELSRIGELVLNPFVGPRFKSVVLTTDMPLEVDRPIDFGLQYFCSNCRKCARECPCDAIPLGPKIVFNGYEIWKPDVERCARYRLTNSKGSACGRCMKTCPLNKVVTADGPLVIRIASWLGVNAMWFKPVMVPIAAWLDDYLGNGKRHPVKKWWLDLEIVDGVCVAPVNGVNERDLDLSQNIDPAKQKMALYPANMMPVPNDTHPQPVDRKAARAAMTRAETPLEALVRRARDEAMPADYLPTPAVAGGPQGPGFDLQNYGEGAAGDEAKRP